KAAAVALKADGFVRILIDGEERRLDDDATFALLDDKKTSRVDLVLDRVRVDATKRSRLAEALEEAFRRGGGVAGAVVDEGGAASLRLEWSTRRACDDCGWYPTEELTPRHFSFNHHFGACPECLGLGRTRRAIESKLVVDPSKPLFAGALLHDYPGRYFTKKGGW